MVLSRVRSSDHVEDAGDLAILVAIPSLVVISVLAVLGFSLLASVLSIVVFLGVLPLLLVFGDSLVTPAPDENSTDDPLEALREQYVEGDLSHAALERAVERELAGSSDDADPETAPDGERLSEREEL